MTEKSAAPAPRHVSESVVLGLSLAYILFFSTGNVATKMALKFTSPLLLLATRSLVAGLILWGVAWLLGSQWPTTRRAILLLIFRGLIQAANWGSTFVALRTIPAGLVSIGYATMPLILSLVGPWLLGEKRSAKRTIGALAGFAAVAFVLTGRIGSGQAGSPIGLLWMTAGVGLGVLSIVHFKLVPPLEHPVIFQSSVFLTMAVVLGPLALVFERPSLTVITPVSLGLFLYLLLAQSLGATLIFRWLLLRGEASVVTSYQFVNVLLGVGLATLLLGEKFTLRDAIGIVVVVIAVRMMRATPPKASPAPPKVPPAPVMAKRF